MSHDVENADRLVVIGSKGGPAMRTRGPGPTAFLLQVGGRPIVIDCGLGVTRGFVDAGEHLNRLGLIFITHHHSDHNLEFGNLIHTAWTAGLANRVQAYGPEGLEHLWRGFLDMNRFDITTRIADEGRPELSGLVGVTEYREGLVHSEPGMTVTALRNVHPPVIESYALKFEITRPGKPLFTLVFSGDTTYFPPLADFARSADILVHEGLFMPGVDRLVARVQNGARLKEHLVASHTVAEDVGRIASAADVGHLIVNHLVPADDPQVTEADWAAAVRTTYAGELTVAHDGLVVPLT
jgi:ribonuclease BN (tRNA processing enzyme)